MKCHTMHSANRTIYLNAIIAYTVAHISQHFVPGINQNYKLSLDFSDIYYITNKKAFQNYI